MMTTKRLVLVLIPAVWLGGDRPTLAQNSDPSAASCSGLLETLEGLAAQISPNQALSDEHWEQVAPFLETEVGVVVGTDYYPLASDEPRRIVGTSVVTGDELRRSMPQILNPLRTDSAACEDGLCRVRAGLHTQWAYYVLRAADGRCLLAGFFIADDLVSGEAEEQIEESRRAWLEAVLTRFAAEPAVQLEE